MTADFLNHSGATISGAKSADSCGLLVSVRSLAEARDALRAGVTVLDVKEPRNGSLGRPNSDVPGSILREISSSEGSTAPDLSVALGELSEWWNGAELRTSLVSEYREALLQFPVYLKLGLSGCGTSRPGRFSTWFDQWQRLRRTFPADARWVAVAYADFEQAGAPEISVVCQAAIQTGCRALLIDTFRKDGKGLLSWISVEELLEIRSCTRSAGLSLALAGQLTLSDLPRIACVGPDLVAVRGAVCDTGSRAHHISQARIREFAQALRECL